MKNKTFLALFFCAILVAALREGDRQTSGGKAATGIAFLLPQSPLDLSDLDVRDAQNRPLKSSSATQALAALFNENLLNLTVFASPHAMTEVMSLVDSLSHLFNKLILSRLPIAFESFQDVCPPSSRRFVHNVHNLWIMFSVGIFAVFLLLSAFSLKRSSLQVYLRL